MTNLTTDANGLVQTSANTAVNPQYATPQALTDAYKYNVGDVSNIDVKNLTSSSNLVFPEMTQPSSTTASAYNAGYGTKMEQAKSAYDAEAAKQQEQAEEGANSARSGYWDYIKQKVGITEEKAAAVQSPEYLTKQKSVNDAYSAYQKSKQEQAAEIQAVQDSAQYPEMKSQAIAQINNKYALKNTNLATEYDIVNRDFQSAQDNIDKAAEIKMEAIQPFIDYYDKVLTINEGKLSKADENILNAKREEYQTLQQQEADNIKANGEAMIKYNSLGAGVTMNDTAEERGRKIASVGGELGYLTQIEKIKNQASITPGVGGDAPLYNGLSSPTATAVRGIVSGFKSEPQLTNFATIQDGYNFTQMINTDTKNPADDQALVYALAKALDPGSVVREGEYKTALTYSQSWAKAYGKSVEQAVAGTGFLSKTARENIKNVIETKYLSSKKSYDNLYGSYAAQINNLTGREDGSKFLRDYAVNTSSSLIPYKVGDTGKTTGGTGFTILPD